MIWATDSYSWFSSRRHTSILPFTALSPSLRITESNSDLGWANRTTRQTLNNEWALTYREEGSQYRASSFVEFPRNATSVSFTRSHGNYGIPKDLRLRHLGIPGDPPLFILSLSLSLRIENLDETTGMKYKFNKGRNAKELCNQRKKLSVRLPSKFISQIFVMLMILILRMYYVNQFFKEWLS